MDCVHVINEDGSGSVFGSTGKGELEFRGLNSLVVDSAGNMIVCDGLTNRLQVVSSKNQFLGLVKVRELIIINLHWTSAFCQVDELWPIILCLDEKRKELYIYDKLVRSLARYQM